MLSPEQQQLALRELLRGRPVDLAADAWLIQVAHSRGLALLRQIGAWWQRFQLESQCRYTTRLMKRLGCFESYLAAWSAECAMPPSIEELSAQFLASLRCHEDGLVRVVASFELACLASPAERRATTVTFWDRNPDLVMDALSRGTPLPLPERDALYVLRIGPGGISCTRKPIVTNYQASELFTLPSRSTRQSYAARWQRPAASGSPGGSSGAAHIHGRPERRHEAPPGPRPSSAP
jgi:hypothetical protein